MKTSTLINRNLVLQYMPEYGFLPFLYLLEEYEKSEQYENCQVIFEVLNEMSQYWGLMLPTRLNDYAIEYYFKAMKESKQEGRIAFSYMPQYVEEIKHLLNKSDEKICITENSY